MVLTKKAVPEQTYTNRYLTTYALIDYVQIQRRKRARVHSCRQAHNQCSPTAGQISGGAWPDRWPMHCTSPVVPVHAWVCACTCVCVYQSESQLVIQATLVYFCLQVEKAPVHNGAATCAQCYRKLTLQRLLLQYLILFPPRRNSMSPGAHRWALHPPDRGLELRTSWWQ